MNVASVIIPVYNGAAVIGPCLDAVLQQELPRETYEVIVVDNGSTDGTVDVVRRYPVRLATEGVRSSYAARNAGIRLARGAVLAFTDADCRPSHQWLSAAIEMLAHGADMVGGRIKQDLHDRGNPWEQYDRLVFLNQRLYVTYGWAATANLIVRRALFERVGPFRVGESGYDQEWCLRAVAQGARLRYSTHAMVRHLTRKRFSEMAARLRRVNTAATYPAYQQFQRLRRSRKWLYLLSQIMNHFFISCWRTKRFAKAILRGRLPLRVAATLCLVWPVLEGMRFAAFCRAWRRNRGLQPRPANSILPANAGDVRSPRPAQGPP